MFLVFVVTQEGLKNRIVWQTKFRHTVFIQVHVYFLQDEDPLNSDDDVSDDDPADLFDTDNVVVCQFDKVQRPILVWQWTGSKVSLVMDWREEKGSKTLLSCFPSSVPCRLFFAQSILPFPPLRNLVQG